MLSQSQDFPKLAALPSRSLDNKNLRFTTSARERLLHLSDFTTEQLEWLMVEHYQFSFRNPAFLATAAKTTSHLDNPAVAVELDRNFNEERSHAAMYRRALAEIDIDVDKRLEFPATSHFFARLEALITGSAACALGAMYATETAAIFEHEVFWSISREVAQRGGHDWGRSHLKTFHDMHLAGVEQSHKDGLAAFLDQRPSNVIHKSLVLFGGTEAIRAMEAWWNALLERIGARQAQ